jgi:hypothetical protein
VQGEGKEEDGLSAAPIGKGEQALAQHLSSAGNGIITRRLFCTELVENGARQAGREEAG